MATGEDAEEMAAVAARLRLLRTLFVCVASFYAEEPHASSTRSAAQVCSFGAGE